MCGIVGIINFSQKKGNINRENLVEMRDTMIHRGPDDCGVYFDNFVGLGHRRLSILDLSEKGRQPMEYKKFVITFNGEIYNFKDIKKELEALGHNFISQTDTEVILHAYEEWKEECLDKFNGMFSFGLYDKGNQEIFIARDRLGIKPLYYYQGECNMLVFASEIKAICRYENYKPEINKDVLFDFFRYSFVPGKETLMKNIKEVLPGHYLKIRISCKNNVNSNFKKYWDLPTSKSNDSIEEAQHKIESLLKDSVKHQLISDVKVGLQLSGGLDSSLIASYASQLSPHVNAISVDVVNSELSEKKYAKYVTDKLNLNAHFIPLYTDNFYQDLERVLYIFDEPLPHANAIGIYLLSKYAKEKVTVLLSGEGADELFCGYTRYKELKAYQLISRIPFSFIRKKIARCVLGECYYNYLTEIQERPFDNFYIKNVYNCVSKKELKKIFTKNVKVKDNNGFFKIILKQLKNKSIVNAASGYDLKNYLVSLLHRQDRMSMAFSIENRVPFLDHHLVEYVYTLPEKFKIKNGITKYILKQNALRYFNQEFVFRPKQGFSIPISDWLKSFDGQKLLSILLDDTFKERGIFNYREVGKMVKNFNEGKETNVGLLWALVVFEKWARIYLKN